MAATREDLRDHLAAVIEAAHELPAEDRIYLADGFLDELERQYQLVPRSQTRQPNAGGEGRLRFASSPFAWWPVPLGVLFVLPFVLLSLFVLVHPPVLLLALVLLLLFRFGRPWMRRGRPWGRGPRQENIRSLL